MFTGLSKEQVEKSRKEHGSNIIQEAEPETFFDKFKEAFGSPQKLMRLGKTDE